MIIRTLLAFLLALIMAASAAGRDFALSHQQETLFLDVEDGRLDRFSLLQAAMLCTAPATTDVNAWHRRFLWHSEQCSRTIPTAATGSQRAEIVFRYLHSQVLTSAYNENSNCVSQTLKTGTFNCITSTLLYVCLCRECGLDARAIAVPNHVLVRLPLHGPSLVETTHPGFMLLHPQDPRIPNAHLSREISDVALLGRLYYNQAIRLAHQNRYAEAMKAARRSCQLDPFDTSARTNLLATLNNWAISLCAQGDYPRAAHLVRQGLTIDSTYAPLSANDAYVHHKWISDLRRQGHHEEADTIEREFRTRLRQRTVGS